MQHVRATRCKKNAHVKTINNVQRVYVWITPTKENKTKEKKIHKIALQGVPCTDEKVLEEYTDPVPNIITAKDGVQFFKREKCEFRFDKEATLRGTKIYRCGLSHDKNRVRCGKTIQTAYDAKGELKAKVEKDEFTTQIVIQRNKNGVETFSYGSCEFMKSRYAGRAKTSWFLCIKTHSKGAGNCNRRAKVRENEDGIAMACISQKKGADEGNAIQFSIVNLKNQNFFCFFFR